MSEKNTTTDPQQPSAQSEPLRRGAVVLCGGNSTRMGYEKARLLFAGRTFLECVLTTVRQVADEVVVVSSTGRAFDFLPDSCRDGVEFLHDEQTDKGPVEGIRVGLRRLERVSGIAFVTSCDVPRLKHEVIELLFRKLGDHQAVVPTRFDPANPVLPARSYGMTAVYRTALHRRIGEMICDGRLRVSDLASEFDTLRIGLDKIRTVDPNLDSLTNVNSPDDYHRLLAVDSQIMSDEIRRALDKRE